MPPKKKKPVKARPKAAAIGKKTAPGRKAPVRGKKPKPAVSARSKSPAKKRAAVEFKIVQTVETGPDAEGKGCIGDRMAEEAAVLAQHGWKLIAAHRSDSARYKLTFLVGCFKRMTAAATPAKSQAPTKTSYKCKEYRPDAGSEAKPDDFLSKIYADASRMADKGWELASFFLTEDGAMTGMYRSEKG